MHGFWCLLLKGKTRDLYVGSKNILPANNVMHSPKRVRTSAAFENFHVFGLHFGFLISNKMTNLCKELKWNCCLCTFLQKKIGRSS